MVVHAVNSVMKIFAATKIGTEISSGEPSVIHMSQILTNMQFADLLAQHPTAFFDKLSKRFVVTWGTQYQGAPGAVAAPLLVCVSESDNPVGQWTCWALDSTLEAQPSVAFCGGAAAPYFPDYPQCES
jgi:hypothetical protein